MLKQSSPTMVWRVRRFVAAAELRAEETHAAPLHTAIFGSDQVILGRGENETDELGRKRRGANRPQTIEDDALQGNVGQHFAKLLAT